MSGADARAVRLASTLPPDSIRIATDTYTQPFWEAAKDERLVAPRCTACATFRFPPTPFCPHCRARDVDWVELTGPTIFSYSVVRGFPGLPDLLLVPVVVAFDNAPGVHVVANVVDVAPEDVAIGHALSLDFLAVHGGWKIPIYRLA